MGRSARYIASVTREASSISSIDTFENPRTVPSIPGSPTILDPFGKTSEIALLPSPFTGNPSAATISAAFRTNSPDCRYVGLATSTRLFGQVNARCTAFAAAIVDLPHCRVQLRMPRFASDRSTSACFSSGSIPSRVRANSTASGTLGFTLACSGSSSRIIGRLVVHPVDVTNSSITISFYNAL